MGPTRVRLGKPVIAAVAGHAVAGGLELASWRDLRVAEENAVFGVFCRRWGVPLIDGGTVRLPRLIGLSRSMDMILTGRPVDAPEALQIGLVNRVVPIGSSCAAAEELALALARLPQTCMREDRLSVLEQEGLDEAAAMAGELAHGMRSLEHVQAGWSGSAPGRAARLFRVTRVHALTPRAGAPAPGRTTRRRRRRSPGRPRSARRSSRHRGRSRVARPFDSGFPASPRVLRRGWIALLAQSPATLQLWPLGRRARGRKLVD